jgi:hypothetical protein
MRMIRRLIIAVSEILGLVFLIGATLLGGGVGAMIQQAGRPGVAQDLTAGFAAGAVAGFIPAALALASLWALFEIAANTRETASILRRIAAGSREP